MHKQKAKGKKINKLRVPAIYDPEDPDNTMIAADQDADQSLFMADISLINGGTDRSYSDVAGTMTTNKMLN